LSHHFDAGACRSRKPKADIKVIKSNDGTPELNQRSRPIMLAEESRRRFPVVWPARHTRHEQKPLTPRNFCRAKSTSIFHTTMARAPKSLCENDIISIHSLSGLLTYRSAYGAFVIGSDTLPSKYGTTMR
jgi:hypothetical protein